MKKERLEEIRAQHVCAGELDSYEDHGCWNRSKELLAEVDRLRGVLAVAGKLLKEPHALLAVNQTATLIGSTVDGLED